LTAQFSEKAASSAHCTTIAKGNMPNGNIIGNPKRAFGPEAAMPFPGREVQHGGRSRDMGGLQVSRCAGGPLCEGMRAASYRLSSGP
jgi:hypothetical protein